MPVHVTDARPVTAIEVLHHHPSQQVIHCNRKARSMVKAVHKVSKSYTAKESQGQSSRLFTRSANHTPQVSAFNQGCLQGQQIIHCKRKSRSMLKAVHKVSKSYTTFVNIQSRLSTRSANHTLQKKAKVNAQGCSQGQQIIICCKRMRSTVKAIHKVSKSNATSKQGKVQTQHCVHKVSKSFSAKVRQGEQPRLLTNSNNCQSCSLFLFLCSNTLEHTSKKYQIFPLSLIL